MLTRNDKCDIDAMELTEEIMTLKVLTSEDKPEKLLEFVHTNGMSGTFPNFLIAVRILLTIPVSVASSERSFSKLRLIKNYLRSTMCEDRLSNLAILSIENEISNELNVSELIAQFAKNKARKCF